MMEIIPENKQNKIKSEMKMERYEIDKNDLEEIICHTYRVCLGISRNLTEQQHEQHIQEILKKVINMIKNGGMFKVHDYIHGVNFFCSFSNRTERCNAKQAFTGISKYDGDNHPGFDFEKFKEKAYIDALKKARKAGWRKVCIGYSTYHICPKCRKKDLSSDCYINWGKLGDP